MLQEWFLTKDKFATSGNITRMSSSMNSIFTKQCPVYTSQTFHVPGRTSDVQPWVPFIPLCASWDLILWPCYFQKTNLYINSVIFISIKYHGIVDLLIKKLLLRFRTTSTENFCKILWLFVANSPFAVKSSKN